MEKQARQAAPPSRLAEEARQSDTAPVCGSAARAAAMLCAGGRFELLRPEDLLALGGWIGNSALWALLPNEPPELFQPFSYTPSKAPLEAIPVQTQAPALAEPVGPIKSLQLAAAPLSALQNGLRTGVGGTDALPL